MKIVEGTARSMGVTTEWPSGDRLDGHHPRRSPHRRTPRNRGRAA